MSNTKNSLPWGLWAIWTLIAIALVVAIAAEEDAANLTPLQWASLAIGFAPLIGAQMALGSPKAAEKTRAWLAQTRYPLLCTAGGIMALYILSALLAGHFDPYATAIFGFGAFATLGTLRQIGKGKPGLTWADAAIWLLIWIPFDLRWNYDLWFGLDGFAYNWWAIMLSVLTIVGWYGFRQLPNFGYRLIPNRKDIVTALTATAIFAAIIIPVGLAIDFLTFPPTTPLSAVALLTHFIGLFLTVAIPEELFFRGLLLNGLDQMLKRPWLSLLLSALAFGLMHWNNADDLTTKIAYCSLATVAGLFYGWAYRRSGNNLLAAVIVHTLTDLIWRFLFQ